MPYGYHGKILHVDLTTGKMEVETPPESFYRKYMGGGAMALYYILCEVPKGADPLGPENLLTIFDSVVTGASISGQSRINVNAKSPMSGGIGDSQAGGFFPAEFKFAGYDGVVFRGKSPKWVYLTIINGETKLNDASHLLGKVTGEVDKYLKQEVSDPKAQVMQVGPAAEIGVRFSGIVNMANRMNGRTGMGLVMASKNLKAIVVRGRAKPAIADQKALTELNRAGPPSMVTNPDMSVGALGTAGVVMFQNMLGTLPTRNYNEGQFEQAEAISGEKLAETILKQRDTCYACIVRCKRVVEITEGKYTADPLYGGAEYETLGTFGSYCGIGDLAAVSHAHQICDMVGVDSISCGATIAFAMECYEKGIIIKEDTGGIDLRFGNTDAMIEVLKQIVTKSGKLGPVLAEGSARAAELWGKGADECLVTCKNEEAPAHMPQVKRSLALIYAVNPFGADHQSSEHDPYYEEGVAQFNLDRLKEMGLGEPQLARSLTPEKVRFAYLTQCFYSMLDSLTLCQFVYGPTWCLYGPNDTARMVRAVTGWDVTVDELIELGHRRIALMRTFNAREGFTRKDDKLPRKFFKPLVGVGPSAGVALTHEEMESALDEYYKLAGFTNDGIPTPKTLKQLDIEWAAKY
ncbi:MAG: aldehyde ferredoxin oxidoreductase family protein, partial [Chloroflexi bacterium]|nr:aldehyde ferredoxin oxidoreductase family protein [Chloroflexota bacterium]